MVTNPKGSSLHDHRSDRTAPLVALGLDHRADSTSGRISLVITEVGNEKHHIQEIVKPSTCSCRDGDEGYITAIIFDNDIGFCKFGFDSIGIGIWLVNLVERDDDRHISGARMADRFLRLRHHTVVRSDHNDRDICHARTASAHRRKRLMARGVKEEDGTVTALHLAGPKVLGDAATLAGGNACLPQCVEQARLAVVNVPHDRHDWRARA